MAERGMIRIKATRKERRRLAGLRAVYLASGEGILLAMPGKLIHEMKKQMSFLAPAAIKMTGVHGGIKG